VSRSTIECQRGCRNAAVGGYRGLFARTICALSPVLINFHAPP